MTFEHEPHDTMSVVQEYALAEVNGTKLQIVRVMIESLKRYGSSDAQLIVSGKPFDQRVDVSPGMVSVYLATDAVQEPAAAPLSVWRSESVISSFLKRDSLTMVLRPVIPFHYIPADQERESVSKALEYAYDDWCIAQMAKALGKTADAMLFEERAGYCKNLYDPSTGFMRGRNSDESWVTPFDPRFGTEKQPEYTEGNAWQYSWYVPQDVPG